MTSPTNLTSSIQVSEEALRVGAEMLCNNHSMLAGDEDAWRLHVDEARSIYLAMRSKDHSIAVDDVREALEKAEFFADLWEKEPNGPDTLRAAIAFRTARASLDRQGK